MAHRINASVAARILELLTLNNTARAGWARIGVPLSAQQSVASHSFGAMMVAIFLALANQQANVGRAAILGAVHDIGETRTGDIARLLKEILEEQGLTKEQIDARAEELQRQGLPMWLQKFLKDALDEYRTEEALEAKIAFDAQLIEMGIQALIYLRLGYPAQEFTQIENQLKTEEGKSLWETIREDPQIFTAWFSQRQT